MPRFRQLTQHTTGAREQDQSTDSSAAQEPADVRAASVARLVSSTRGRACPRAQVATAGASARLLPAGACCGRAESPRDRGFPPERAGETSRDATPSVLAQRQVRLSHPEPRGRVLLRPAFPLKLLPEPSSVDLAPTI